MHLTSKQIKDFINHPVWDELLVMMRSKDRLLDSELRQSDKTPEVTQFIRGRLQELQDIRGITDVLLKEVEQYEFELEQEGFKNE